MQPAHRLSRCLISYLRSENIGLSLFKYKRNIWFFMILYQAWLGNNWRLEIAVYALFSWLCSSLRGLHTAERRCGFYKACILALIILLGSSMPAEYLPVDFRFYHKAYYVVSRPKHHSYRTYNAINTLATSSIFAGNYMLIALIMISEAATSVTSVQ